MVQFKLVNQFEIYNVSKFVTVMVNTYARIMYNVCIRCISGTKRMVVRQIRIDEATIPVAFCVRNWNSDSYRFFPDGSGDRKWTGIPVGL